MKQYIKMSSGLTEAQFTAIEQLEAVCNRADGLTMKLNPEMLRERSPGEINDFLYYVDEQPVAYLALFSFNKKEVEVSAMTHPDYRRQGIFKQLLAAARDEVNRRHIPDFLFICERRSAAGAQTVQAVGARYDFSEYKMILEEAARPPSTSTALDLRPALAGEVAELARMDVVCFGTDFEEGKKWIAKSFASEHRRMWVATLPGITIGKILVSLTGHETFINAFCVMPEYRGRGYGKTILSRLVAQLVGDQHPLISLEVATDNEGALSLYKNAGFEISTVYDYYRLPPGS